MKRCFGVYLIACLMMATAGLADTHYVSLAGGHGSPFTSWATAATNIQAAVDVAGDGDTVLVADGTYVLTERIVVANAIVVHSVNGPDVTFVDGSQSYYACFYLRSSCSLVGFTIANANNPDDGGGVYSDVSSAIISNCMLTENTAYNGGGAYNCTLNNCTLTGNLGRGAAGGGAYKCILNNCTLTDNTAIEGAGAYNCTLNYCTLSENSTGGSGGGGGGGACGSTLNYCTLSKNVAGGYGGGGAYKCTLNYCTLSENSAYRDSYTYGGGGGAYNCTLNSCTLSANATEKSGGGAYDSTLNNCLLILNTAEDHGGGGYDCTFNNCTISENAAINDGGGAYGSTLNNCIAYYNGADNLSGTIVRYSCAPDAPAGYNNITEEPCFMNREAGYYRLTSVSPCINAGRNALAPTSSALDGNDRIRNGNVDMGAYEFQLGPYVTANGLHMRPVAVYAGESVVVEVQMNPGQYAGALVDWWVVIFAGSSWFYMDSVAGWTEFDGNLSNCHPVYQGALFNLSVTEVLNITGLPIGSYTFYFAVDYPMDGILNVNGSILADAVNVIVQ